MPQPSKSSMLEVGAWAFAPIKEKQKARRIISLFIGSLLDRKEVCGVYCPLHIPENYVKSSGTQEAMMEQNDKTGKVTTTLQEITFSNMFLVEAIFELLAEKGILTGEEVLERIKKLKSEATLQFRFIQ